MVLTDTFSYWIEKNAQGTFTCRFSAVPECSVTGASIEKCLPELQPALLECLHTRIKNGVPLPAQPVHKNGDALLELTPNFSVKLQLIQAAHERQITTSELARLIGCLPQEGSRILNITHPTKIDTLATAIEAIGGHLHCRVSFDE